MVEIILFRNYCQESVRERELQLPLHHTRYINQEVFSSRRDRACRCHTQGGLACVMQDALKPLDHVISVHVRRGQNDALYFTSEDIFRPYVACLPLAALLPAGTTTASPHPAERTLHRVRSCTLSAAPDSFPGNTSCERAALAQMVCARGSCTCHRVLLRPHRCLPCPADDLGGSTFLLQHGMWRWHWEVDGPFSRTSDSPRSTLLSHGPPSSCIPDTRDAVIKHL